jgi:hypothetical protein
MVPCTTSRLDLIREAVGTFAVVYLVFRFLSSAIEKAINRRPGK